MTTYNVVISKWVGGLGNNLVQLYHSIYLAQRLFKAGVKYPVHPILVGTYLPLRLSAYTPHDIIGEFFQRSDVEHLLQGTLPKHPSKQSVFRNYIRPLLNLHPERSLLVSFRYVNHLVMPYDPPLLHPLEDTLVIHIRSGDVTNGKDAHPNYVQPPLAFYQHVIQNCNSKHVIVISQDNSNPTVEALQQWMPTIQLYVNRSLYSDMVTLLQAQHLCYGKSWLPVTMALCSENVKHIHVLDDMHNSDFIPTSKGCHIHHYCLTQPYIQVGHWQNSSEQRQLMITYPQSGVMEIK